jgi:hypothetical protein
MNRVNSMMKIAIPVHRRNRAKKMRTQMRNWRCLRTRATGRTSIRTWRTNKAINDEEILD